MIKTLSALTTPGEWRTFCEPPKIVDLIGVKVFGCCGKRSMAAPGGIVEGLFSGKKNAGLIVKK